MPSEYDMVVAPEVIGDELVQGDESAKALASAMGKTFTLLTSTLRLNVK